MMTTRDPYTWGACPQGEWQRLSAGLLFRKWMIIARNAAIGLFAVLALAGGTWVAAAQLSKDHESQAGTPCHPASDCGTAQPDCGVTSEPAKKE